MNLCLLEDVVKNNDSKKAYAIYGQSICWTYKSYNLQIVAWLFPPYYIYSLM